MTKNEKIVMLRAVVSGFVTREQPFTSVEITNHMKKIAVWIPNRHVAEYLRQNALDIADEYGVDYRVSHVRVDTTKGYQTARCYHEKSFCASAYLARDIRAITPDEFEAMHGIEAVVSIEEKVKKSEIFVNGSGRLEFNFPGGK